MTPALSPRDAFEGLPPPRVWSLIVTIFGDLAQDEGHALSGTAIGAITGALGIKPEATRVALHRLRKEGWLTSARSGRESTYALTETGRRETIAASARIYNFASPEGPVWMVTADTAACPEGATPLGPSTWLTRSRPSSTDLLVAQLEHEADALPSWLAARICPEGFEDQGEALLKGCEVLRARMDHAAPQDALAQAATRVIVVHEWRRLILRCPDLPDDLLPRRCAIAPSRAAVADILARVPCPKLKALESAARSQT